MPPAAGMRWSAGRVYLPEACAADEEHRELAGVPEEVMFASKPQLAGSLIERATLSRDPCHLPARQDIERRRLAV